MIECRRLMESDVQAVVQYAIDGMRAEHYPLHVDAGKVLQWVLQFLPDDAPHFNRLAFNDGRLAGVVAAYVSELPFFERHEASVVMCRATYPGAGRMLIRLMTEWVEDNMMIRRVVFPLEEDADPRQAMLLRRFDFTHEQTNLIYFKGCSHV